MSKIETLRKAVEVQNDKLVTVASELSEMALAFDTLGMETTATILRGHIDTITNSRIHLNFVSRETR